jgi:hypothetical protein
VRRALPAVWDLADPAAALAARQAGAVAAVRRLLGLQPADEVPAAVAAAADQLMAAAAGLDQAGRALAAPNIALPVPAEPVARLWHAATVLREHRGDGHVAALVAADIDGAEALALRAGADRAYASPGQGAADQGAAGQGAAGQGAAGQVTAAWSRDQMQPARGWTDAEWDAAVTRLADRGLTDGGGTATAAGTGLHREIEQATDRAAARPWASLGPTRTAGLADLLLPIAAACATAMPFPNPIGVPSPAAVHPPAA